MSLTLKKVAKGVIMTPKAEECYPGAAVLYPRVIELHHAGEQNGTLLATFDHSTIKEPPVSPIYRSTDHGLTWEHYSDMADTKNGWGIRFQPTFYELPVDCGDLPAGTIVFSGNAVPLQAFADNNPPDFIGTELQFYISRDHGKTWEYRSSFAYGGVPREYNFDCLGPVWEPFIYINAYGEITIVFTDEKPHTNRALNQCLAVISSKDGGKTWGESKLIVAIPDGIRRPGMAIVTKLPNNKYMMVYEVVNDAWQGIHFKMSDDGMDWGDPADKGTRIETADGKFLGNMPYVVWTKHGGPNGTIIVSAHHDGDVNLPDGGWVGLKDPGNFLVNYNLGEGYWEEVPMLVSYDSTYLQAGWSMGMALIEDETKLIQLCPSQIDKDTAEMNRKLQSGEPTLLEISFGIGVLGTK